MGGHAVAEALQAHIGDAVAVGIGQTHPGRIGEVQAEAVRRAEARALADEDHHHLRAEQFRHFIRHRDAALLHQHHRRERPALGQRLFFHALQEGQGMALHGEGGKTVGHHHREVIAARVGPGVLLQDVPGWGIQAPAQVRTLQIGVAVGRGAVQQQGVAAAFGQAGGQAGMVERQVHRVPRLGVGVLEVQLRGGGQAGAGTPQGDACGRQAAQLLPGVGGVAGELAWGLHPSLLGIQASRAIAWRKAGGS
ncbi:hypothetical protein D3C80_1061510 [compost metagenome]